jgi:oligopeptide/dipeptide ABC transporter ATP-binding protein
MSEPLVEVRDLVKHFPLTRGVIFQKQVGAVRAVDGATFEVRRGETFGLVGETGCGKSTTARLLVKLLEPTGGSIRFEGDDVTGIEGERLQCLRRDVQMIFQDPYSALNPRKTVGSIMAEPLEIHRLASGREERKRAVQGLMEQVGLNPEHYNRYPHEFSGGQRQRIGIARALALGPKLIVADEPVSALDVSIQSQILNLLRRLQRELDLTLVLISHDLAVIRHTCERVAVMYLGKIVELAENDDLFHRPKHPYTGALLSAVPVPGPDGARREAAVLGGDVPSATDPPAACRFHPRCPKCRQVCTSVEPELTSQGGSTVAACHFPLRREEVRRLLEDRTRAA